uniref:Uncharacterized protein n=1 Tax=Romanomermis culicivorax TaxID=13658 RepID=A0A915I4X2_ROMCU
MKNISSATIMEPQEWLKNLIRIQMLTNWGAAKIVRTMSVKQTANKTTMSMAPIATQKTFVRLLRKPRARPRPPREYFLRDSRLEAISPIPIAFVLLGKKVVLLPWECEYSGGEPAWLLSKQVKSPFLRNLLGVNQ